MWIFKCQIAISCRFLPKKFKIQDYVFMLTFMSTFVMNFTQWKTQCTTSDGIVTNNKVYKVVTQTIPMFIQTILFRWTCPLKYSHPVIELGSFIGYDHFTLKLMDEIIFFFVYSGNWFESVLGHYFLIWWEGLLFCDTEWF